jgi:hypothetical protein
MSDGVHAAVDPVQAPGGDSLPRRARREVERLELGEGDHAMLPVRELGDSRIEGLDELRDSCSRFSANASHGRQDAAGIVTAGALVLRARDG